jgi:hypothetical protein
MFMHQCQLAEAKLFDVNYDTDEIDKNRKLLEDDCERMH